EEADRARRMPPLGERERDQRQPHADEHDVAVADLAARSDHHQLAIAEPHRCSTNGLAPALSYGWRRTASSFTSTPSPGPCGTSTWPSFASSGSTRNGVSSWPVGNSTGMSPPQPAPPWSVAARPRPQQKRGGRDGA